MVGELILAVGAASRRPIVDEPGAITVDEVMTVTFVRGSPSGRRCRGRGLDLALIAEFVRLVEKPLTILA